MGKSALVADIFAFQRQHDRHRSLRKKHNVYKTGTIKGKQTRFHIDAKPITIAVYLKMENILFKF
jgi:hypothetical protein